MWIYLFERLFLLCSEIWNFDQTIQERCFYIFLVRASFTKIKKKWCCDPFDHSVHIDHPCPCNPIFFFFTLPSSSSGQSMFDGEGSVRSITNQLCSMPPDGLWASSGVDFGGAHEDPYFDYSESLTGVPLQCLDRREHSRISRILPADVVLQDGVSPCSSSQ